MSLAQECGLPSREDPMRSRRALRAEKAELLRWRRLLRARLDLAVASFAPPEALGAVAWDLLPQAHRALPHDVLLRDAVAVEDGVDRVALMQGLRELDRALATYGSELDAALERCTDQLVARLAGDLETARTPVPTP